MLRGGILFVFKCKLRSAIFKRTDRLFHVRYCEVLKLMWNVCVMLCSVLVLRSVQLINARHTPICLTVLPLTIFSTHITHDTWTTPAEYIYIYILYILTQYVLCTCCSLSLICSRDMRSHIASLLFDIQHSYFSYYALTNNLYALNLTRSYFTHFYDHILVISSLHRVPHNYNFKVLDKHKFYKLSTFICSGKQFYLRARRSVSSRTA